MNIKKIITIGVSGVAMGAMALDKVEVTGVTARQRYPWNGLVDIDFTTDSTPTEPYQMKVVAFDNVGKTNLPVKTVYTEGVSFKENPCMVRTDTRRILWDAAADLPNGFKATNVLVSCQDVRANPATNTYMIVDLTGGTNAEHFAVSYTNAPPPGGWTEEYMTTKLVLRRIEPTYFVRDSSEKYSSGQVIPQKVSLTKPYYIGVFKLTTKQRALIFGGSGADTQTASEWWNVVRGFDVSSNVVATSTSNRKVYSGMNYSLREIMTNVTISVSIKQDLADKSNMWPFSQKVQANSIIGTLREKTGLQLDLPSEAQWEFACRAGASGTSSGATTGDAKLDPTGTHYIYQGNYIPNAYGLYDMTDGSYEWCLDYYPSNFATNDVVDPICGEPTYSTFTLFSSTLTTGNEGKIYQYENGYTYPEQYKIEFTTQRTVQVKNVKYTFPPDVKIITGEYSSWDVYKTRSQTSASFTAYGVQHVVRSGINRKASGVTINNTGNPFSTGYYGVKATRNSSDNPAYSIRIALTVDE